MAMPSDIDFRLVYVSRISPDCEIDVDVVLSEIRLKAQPRNRKTGLTGLLMAHRGWFIQVLEGPETSVRAAFKAICEDRRHRLRRIMVEEPVGERLFPRWPLATRILSPPDAAVLRGFDKADWFDPTALPERTVMRLAAVVGKAHQQAFNTQQRIIAIQRRPEAGAPVPYHH